MTKITNKTKALIVKMNPTEYAMVKRLSASKGITMAELVRQLLWADYQSYYSGLFQTSQENEKVSDPGYDPDADELQLHEFDVIREY